MSDVRTILDLSQLLAFEGIQRSTRRVAVARHVPSAPKLQKALPWLAAEKHEIYNAYQRAQKPGATVFRNADYLVSCIGHPKGALFIGIYKVAGHRAMSFGEYWEMPCNEELQKLGMTWEREVDGVAWFDLELQDILRQWKGKLLLAWPPGRRWDRWLDGAQFAVEAILEDSALDRDMPSWDRLILSWAELQNLPRRWIDTLTQWRGIYFIHDAADKKGYVGSAYGNENIYGRWMNYAASGDGGNKLLRGRDLSGFRFSILQRVSPDMGVEDITVIESSWKDRLQTKEFGLNLN